jgi:hypothetical protein
MIALTQSTPNYYQALILRLQRNDLEIISIYLTQSYGLYPERLKTTVQLPVIDPTKKAQY